MAELIDMLGKQFGKWTVLELVPGGGRKGAKWLVMCQCGVTAVVYGKWLRRTANPSTRCRDCVRKDYWHEWRRKLTPAQLQERFYKRKARIRRAQRAGYRRKHGIPLDAPIRSSKLVDMTGMEIGAWLVLERAANNSSRKPMWLCRCRSCGFDFVRDGFSLRRGQSSACRQCANKRIAANRRAKSSQSTAA